MKILKRNTLICLAVFVFFGVSPLQPTYAEGILMLVGDVLPLKNQTVWRNLVKLAERKEGENVVIAAAHHRADTYGKFTLRAFQRYGDTAELLPIAEEFQQFSTDYRYISDDENLLNQIRSASTVFFVGGDPQRLSKVLFTGDGAMAAAVQDSYESGGLVVGGIPSRMGVSTATDAFVILSRGEVLPEEIFKGLNLLKKDLYVDQHFFGSGRFAIALVAMHQFGMEQGIGVGLDTAAVVHGNTVEVLGNRGVVIIDVSTAVFKKERESVNIRNVKLSYLENGDRYQLNTNQGIPYAQKNNQFQLLPHVDASKNVLSDPFVVTKEMFQPGQFVKLMYEALDSEIGEARGYAVVHDSREGFSFRFYTGADSRGWLTTVSGEDRFTIFNIYLDVNWLR